jgi:uncharacterized protein (DUF2236 family)
MGRILPTPDEYAGLVPDRESPVWRHASDIRLFATAGYALILQVAHPTVGAGVMDFSNFREDPWGRLNRTLDYVHGTIYGGPELAGEIGRRVRAMHRDIKGVRPDGERYHAMEPRAYAWVHATLASAIVDGHAQFGRRLAPDVVEAFWADWLRLGRLIGVRERDLPADWDGFRAYFDETVRTELVDNPTVHLVLDTLRRPVRPHPVVPEPLWLAARRPLARALHTSTVGMLPPDLRRRLNVRWTGTDERVFRAIAGAARAASPVVVGPLARFGPLYVHARRRALARGDVAARPVGERRVQARVAAG